MLNKINLLRFLIVVLFLSTIAIATETTWRHSGFEISGYDINGSSTYNLTEIRKIEFGWNTSIPAVSETSRAVMYYDDNQKRIMQSLNGGAYQAIVDNTTVNAYTVNAANATGVLPNASIPASAANISSSNDFGAFNQSFDTNVVYIDAVNNRVGVNQQYPRTAFDVLTDGTANTPGDAVSGLVVTGSSQSPTTGMVSIQSNNAMGANLGGNLAFYARYLTGDSQGAMFASIRGLKESGVSNNLDGLMTFHVRTNGQDANTASEKMRIVGSTGNVGIGNTTPVNILAFAVGSATDPIADSWLQYSTSTSKTVLYEADVDFMKVLTELNNSPIYAWKRSENEPIRYGVVVDDPKTPQAVIAYHDGKNNTNSTAPNATPQGIDLGAYIGWLHEVVKAQNNQMKIQEQKITALEARVQKLEDRGIFDILFAKQINYLYDYFNLTKP